MGKNHKNNKLIKRSTLSGRRISNKEVILSDEAIDYVKKQGYFVFTRNQIEKIKSDGIMALKYLIIMVISFVVLMPIITSAPPPSGLDILNIDFSQVYVNTNKTEIVKVYDSQTGIQILTATCRLQIFESLSGETLFNSSVAIMVNNTFYFNIPASVHYQEGDYSHTMSCQTPAPSAKGGFSKLNYKAIDLVPTLPPSNILDKVDLTSTLGIVVFIIMFIIAGILIFTGNQLLGGIIIVILGFVMLYSNINKIFSFIVIIVGFIAGVSGGKK